EYGAIADREGEAMAWPEPEPRRQGREAVEPLIEATIGNFDRVIARKVDDRHRVGQALRRHPGKIAEVVVTAVISCQSEHDGSIWARKRLPLNSCWFSRISHIIEPSVQHA